MDTQTPLPNTDPEVETPSKDLSQDERTAIAELFQAFRESFPQYINRKQQREMIAAVARTLKSGHTSLIEAPTGTGKSASYLIPGISLALQSKKKLVVSTATTSLQDQLARSDLPLIANACEKAGLGTIKFVLAKGRERHLCVTKFNAVSDQGGLFTDSSEIEEINLIRKAWESNTWNGVRDSLDVNISNNSWIKINNHKDQCTGRSCPEATDCPYYKGLDAIAEADVIITNHDYLLACLLNNPQSALSQADDNFYIFDEAHHLAEKCISVFKCNLDLNNDAMDDVMLAAMSTGHDTERIESYVNESKQHLTRLAQAALAFCQGKASHRFEYGVADQSFLDLVLRYQHALQQVFNLFIAAMDAYLERTGTNTALTVFTRMRLSVAKSMLAARLNSIGAFLNVDEDKARWISSRTDKLTLSSSPFDAGRLARKYLWSSVKSAVLTSATFGDINSARMRLGLPNATLTQKLDSPLDYSTSRIVVPQLVLSGADKRHGSMVGALVRRDAYASSARGVLVYFTSRFQMQQVFNGLDAEKQAMTLLQGMLPASQMIHTHKSRIDAGLPSVIFGLDSFAEGVDLPGAYCERVIITKLPFPSPDNPVLATHCEILERKGQNPFNCLMLPMAIIKFAQICGRLIRREGDSGDIIVLDDRIVTKAYASRLIKPTSFKLIERVI